jgi:hypothetical protein
LASGGLVYVLPVARLKQSGLPNTCPQAPGDTVFLGRLTVVGTPRRLGRGAVGLQACGYLLRLLRIVRRIDIFEAPWAISGDLDDSLLIEINEMRSAGR